MPTSWLQCFTRTHKNCETSCFIYWTPSLNHTRHSCEVRRLFLSLCVQNCCFFFNQHNIQSTFLLRCQLTYSPHGMLLFGPFSWGKNLFVSHLLVDVLCSFLYVLPSLSLVSSYMQGSLYTTLVQFRRGPTSSNSSELLSKCSEYRPDIEPPATFSQAIT